MIFLLLKDMYLNSYSRVLVFKECWLFQRDVDNFYLKWIENIVIQLKQLKNSPHVRESQTVLDSGIHAVDSRFQIPGSRFRSFISWTWILYSYRSGVPQLLFIIAFNRGRSIKIWTRMTGIFSLRIIYDQHKILSKRPEFTLLRLSPSKMLHPRISVKLKIYACSHE